MTLVSATQEVVVAEVEKRKQQVHCVLCLGHNKGMEEAATSLAVRCTFPAPSDWSSLWTLHEEGAMCMLDSEC